MHLQLQNTGDENCGPSGRYRPHGVKTPTPLADCCLWLGFVVRTADATGQGYAPIPRSETLPHINKSTTSGTKAVVTLVDTAPHGVETPTPLADC